MANTTDGTAGQSGGKGKRRKGGNVIHVAFGSGGGRVAGSPVAGGGGPPTTPPRSDPREPVTDLFTRREVAKLLDVSETRLRSLDRAKIVSPSGQRGKQRAYTFRSEER